jgi:UDP-N-acetylmuramoylalanine--D-glutamate ligase
MHGQHVLILGCGTSGLAAARWCARWGARVTVADTREAPPELAALRRELPDVRFVSGTFDASLLSHGPFDAVYKSPGLKPDAVAALVHDEQATPRLVAELDLFYSGLRLTYGAASLPPVLAVTGTNGKTTVTSLLAKLCAATGLRVAVAGNIGPSMVDTLGAAIDALARGDDLPQVWVLELSSYQLQDAQPQTISAATVLNLSDDHFDWHGDMRAYQLAKARVFGGAALVAAPVGGAMVLNRADPLVMAMKPTAKAPKGESPREVMTFGLDMPSRAGDFGIEHGGGIDWLVRAAPADETRRSRKAAQQDEEIHLQRFMPMGALRIVGRHNAANALAALALASTLGRPLAPMLYALRDYTGEPHRVESVAVIGDVEYIDDSKGTNVGATVAAVEGLADRKLVVILGGDGKGQNFAPLAAPLAAHARAVALIGRDAPTIEQTLASSLASAHVPLQRFDSLDDAVDACAKWAHAGDAVLLSPACASLDMFRNYEHRAQVFREAVARIAADAGVSL